MTYKKDRLINGIIVIAVILLAFYSNKVYSPPKAISSDSPPSVFSAERAMTHIKEMCRNPHFIGTGEHAKVREYIIKEAKELGLKVEVQTATSFSKRRNRLMAARVNNVIAILKGTNNSKALLICGHYDSMLHTPGAADDGSATAAMLETARALTKSTPLKNDVIFLFTDGEEIGLMGARAFTEEHPLLKNVGVVFNLEARGNTGTSVTFEVSDKNGWIMKEFAKAIPYPFAGSIMYEIYKLMPNDTDFTALKKAGCSGFNAAFIDGYVNYHSMTDTPQHLNLKSLQHHGSYILSFAKHFGNIIIDNTKENDVVFFNPIGHWLILYPGWLNLPLLILAFILYLVNLILGIKKKRLSIWGVVGGFILFVAVTALITFLSSLIQSGIKSLYPQYAHFYSHNFYNIHYYFYVFIGFAIALFSVVYVLFFKKFKTENFQLGAITTFLLLMIVLYLKMPTATYLAMYPLLFVLAAGILSKVFNWSEEENYKSYGLIQLLAVLPAIALLIPFIKMLFITFGLSKGFISTLLMVLLLGILLPQLKAAYNLNTFALPILAGLIALTAFTVGHITSLPNEKQPITTSVVYCLDTDQQKALWASQFTEQDDWNQQFFDEPKVEPLNEIFPAPSPPCLKSTAPLIKLPNSHVTIVEDKILENSKRKLHFTLSSWHKGNSIYIYFQKDAGISKLTIDGKDASENTQALFSSQKSNYFSMIYYAAPANGIDFVLESQTEKPVQIVVIDRKIGLPVIPEFEIKPMPAHIIPDREFSHFTIVKKTFTL